MYVDTKITSFSATSYLRQTAVSDGTQPTVLHSQNLDFSRLSVLSVFVLLSEQDKV